MIDSASSDHNTTRPRTSVLSAWLILFILIGTVSPQIGSTEVHTVKSPFVVGWIENVCLHPGNFIIPAKVDTGAAGCSLHAANAERYTCDGKEWIRFRIKDGEGHERTIDQEIIGTKRIKRHFGGFQLRPMIRLGICLGHVYKVVDVNLVDRSGFEYPMLIGRNFMEGSFDVNPSVKNTIDPVCPKAFELMLHEVKKPERH